MPDLLAHFALSLLVATRILSLRVAILIALAGLAPDVDALVRVHRWFTHSLVLMVPAAIIGALLVRRYKPGLLRHVLLAISLYALHLAADCFTAPTPVAWPLSTTSVAADLGIEVEVTETGISFTARAIIDTGEVDFSRLESFEGPVVSLPGILLAMACAATLLTEHVREAVAKRGCGQRSDRGNDQRSPAWSSQKMRDPP